MMRLRYCFLIALALLPLMVSSARAAEPGPESFAKEFVDAVRSGSVENREAILHPKVRACINEETQPFFDWVFDRQMKYKIPDDYDVSITPVPAKKVLVTAGRSAYPVRPTHQLQVIFKRGQYGSTTVVLMVVFDNGKWYEVLPCPSPEALSQVKEADAQRKEQEQRAKSVADNLSGPVREEVISLAKEGRRVDAIKKLSEATGEDLSVAKYALDMLVPAE